MEGTTYLEHSVLVGSLDSGLMEGMSSPEPLEQSVRNTLSAVRSEEDTTEKISDWEPVAHPVPDITLDVRFWGCLWTVDSWRGGGVWNH